MSYWVTSDTHFNHRKLEQYGRPEGFEVEIIKGLQKIPEGSILLHLGDFCIGAEEYSHAMFMGATHQCAKRILVRGNHDSKSNSWYLSHGWDFVCRSFTDKMFGEKILFKHIPELKVPGLDFQVHGHTHGDCHRDKEVRDIYDDSYHVEVALENTNYQPLKLENLIDSKKEKL